MQRHASNKTLCPTWLPRAFAAAGGAAVALGAFGAHTLKEMRSADQLETWKTATLYLLVHSALGLCLCLISRPEPDTSERTYDIPTLGLKLLFSGAVIFAGALYLLVILQFGLLGAVAPVGGLLMISGWVVLAVRLRI